MKFVTFPIVTTKSLILLSKYCTYNA